MAARRRSISEINVVPYIDVMLVLLVIFMATAPLMTQGVEVDLPNTDSKPLSNEQDDPLVVSIDDEGQDIRQYGHAESGARGHSRDHIFVGRSGRENPRRTARTSPSTCAATEPSPMARSSR